MKLRRLRLENFRQHAYTDLHFDEGMTAIVGPNGSGKSTLVEAITFALYGEQRDKKETVRFYWGKGKRFAVTLWFEFEGREYEVERTHADAHLVQIQGAVLRAHGLSETTKACERLLGLNYDQFVNSFCAEQKQIAFLQFRTNAARQDEVARMLGFDRLRLAEELAGQRRREAALQRETLERTRVPAELLLSERRKAENGLAEANRKAKELAGRQAKISQELAGAESIRVDAERWLAFDREALRIAGDLRGLEVAAEVAAEQVREAEEAAAELATLLPKTESFRASESRLTVLAPKRRLLAEATALREMATRLQDEIAAIPDFDLPAAEREADAAERALLELNQALAKEREAISGSLAATRARLEIAGAALARAEVAAREGRCPECGQPIANAEERVGTYRAEVERTSAEVARLCADLDGCLREPEAMVAARLYRDRCSRALSEMRERNIVREDRGRRLGELKCRIQEILRDDPEIDGLAKEIEELESAVQSTRDAHERSLAVSSIAESLAPRQTEFSRVNAALEAVLAQKLAIERERAKLPFSDASAATDAVAHAQAVAEEVRKLETERCQVETLRDLATRDLALAKARQEEQAGLEREIASLRQAEALHEACAREMRVFRQAMNTEIGPELAARASENLSLLTNGRYLALELDRNFTPSVIEDGVAKPVISGGEEDVVALALRLALSELIQERQGRPMSLLILDEVFGSLDTERRQAVLDRLTALRGRFEQILVITHLEDVHQVADQTIHLRRDPASRATTVGPVLGNS
ncbi:AAA family ATPase [Fimbriimonas ginsengisoli]|uniref:Nuclease SbcCD subunit C n=1 Tax=Fimbriimonas ginsengisoli Gsoil 348 TaxID=661478 RepID=A0A068NYK6_FIMGI|nr:SMC family ATPase [Fimbriimonas ginsengisoli]AIE87024.1 Response regulator receiver [Fimbriimonas ginsengisoli Gsoil 348]